jgi:integrase
VSRLVDTAADAGDRLAALWMVLATTGLRRGEASGLRWSDIDLDRATLTVRVQLVRHGRNLVLTEPKTERSRRSIRLSTRTVAALRAHQARQQEERLAAGPAWQEWHDEGLVFTRPDGAPLSPANLRLPLNQALRRAGLPHLRVHDLRHTAATILLRASIPVSTVSAMLGHESAALTYRVYAHVIPDDQQRAADAIDELLG